MVSKVTRPIYHLIMKSPRLERDIIKFWSDIQYRVGASRCTPGLTLLSVKLGDLREHDRFRVGDLKKQGHSMDNRIKISPMGITGKQELKQYNSYVGKFLPSFPRLASGSKKIKGIEMVALPENINDIPSFIRGIRRIHKLGGGYHIFKGYPELLKFIIEKRNLEFNSDRKMKLLLSTIEMLKNDPDIIKSPLTPEGYIINFLQNHNSPKKLKTWLKEQKSVKKASQNNIPEPKKEKPKKPIESFTPEDLLRMNPSQLKKAIKSLDPKAQMELLPKINSINDIAKAQRSFDPENIISFFIKKCDTKTQAKLWGKLNFKIKNNIFRVMWDNYESDLGDLYRSLGIARKVEFIIRVCIFNLRDRFLRLRG